jgi:hypothetical protein
LHKKAKCRFAILIQPEKFFTSLNDIIQPLAHGAQQLRNIGCVPRARGSPILIAQSPAISIAFLKSI